MKKVHLFSEIGAIGALFKGEGARIKKLWLIAIPRRKIRKNLINWG
jgi:hypothetical protein